MISSSFGEVGVDIPRDRRAEFETTIVKKYENVCNEFDKKIIGMYARGIKIYLVFELVNNRVQNFGYLFVMILKIGVLRKYTKIRTTFPRSDSLRKALYLATEQIMVK